MKRLPAVLVLSLLVSLIAGGCAGPAGTSKTADTSSAPAEPPPQAGDGLFAEISTPRGLIVCELYFDRMPLTVASFVGLAEGKLGPEPRKPYFDGISFHRVVPGFVIQGGDPTGTGNGGPGYQFPDEFASGLRHDGAGILSMANSGPDTNGSQFFITLGPARYLDYVHAIFGRVVKGEDVPAQIQSGDTMQVKIVRRGRAAERFRTDEVSFKERLAKAPRWQPPHFEDRTTLMTGGAPWQAKYVENRLNNLARFTGRNIYVRLFDAFEPESDGQTAQQFASDLASRMPPGSVLACYFANEDRWLLTGGAPGLTVPTIQPKSPPPGRPATPEAATRQRQSGIYHATEQVVSSLIDQTDPK